MSSNALSASSGIKADDWLPQWSAEEMTPEQLDAYSRQLTLWWSADDTCTNMICTIWYNILKYDTICYSMTQYDTI